MTKIIQIIEFTEIKEGEPRKILLGLGDDGVTDWRDYDALRVFAEGVTASDHVSEHKRGL